MPFTDILSKYESFDAAARCASVTPAQVVQTLRKGRLDELDYLTLLSPAASSPECLEMMAQRALETTRRQFGNVIFLFTPLYVSNICDNLCPYCSFAHQHKIRRRHLNATEVRREAELIAQTGLRHILMLTGESRKGASVRYLSECAGVLKDFFSSIAIEVYPLDGSEYAELVGCGVDGLTIYQETYDRGIYAALHRGGPKENFEYRLLAPERACEAGVRAVTVGALLGLAPPLRDAWMSGLHARYILDRFPSVEISGSFPRLRPQEGEFESGFSVDDRTFVQYMTAFRIFMPSAGITVSTRESASFRDSILPLGPTKMSAGVSTSVGRGSGNETESQFEIADRRTVGEMQKNLLARGFQPVTVDWNYALCRDAT
ncbi:MAG: 2-iminoacetate synthase ThiH [Chitinispirillia bacterium]|nr:2-iminoacetate synthase ThiH [Chitinispirillia bacterium]MCL2269324.1 2-iminoacetate synthase ThiH [Chitinispirillia bacterium]